MAASRWSHNWPMMVGMVIIAASCALLQSPHDLTTDGELDALYEQGGFYPPEGTITEGGTVSGSWRGACELYGYPYELELTLTDLDGEVSGTGAWLTDWGEYRGSVEGRRDATGVEMTLEIEDYGYGYNMVMYAEFEGAGLVGSCDAFYGTGGLLELERI